MDGWVGLSARGQGRPSCLTPRCPKPNTSPALPWMSPQGSDLASNPSPHPITTSLGVYSDTICKKSLTGIWHPV